MLSLNLSCFIIPIAGDVQKLYYMQSIQYSTKDKYTFQCEKVFMCHTCFFKQLVQLAVFSVLCVCVCGVCVCVCVCVSIVFCIDDSLQTSPLSEIPQQNNKIFASNSSQIQVLFEDLIKYILSLKNCNTISKKRKQITKKGDVMVKDNSEAISSHAASSHGKCRFYIQLEFKHYLLFTH